MRRTTRSRRRSHDRDRRGFFRVAPIAESPEITNSRRGGAVGASQRSSANEADRGLDLLIERRPRLAHGSC